ncbi:MAG: serine/threonine-protein kinase, partial [Planctomycetota bacterium]
MENFEIFENFEKLLVLLNSRPIALDQFQDYLQYQNHPFEKLTQSLQKRQVPLKEYSDFLTQIAARTQNASKKISSLSRLESIGCYLLSHRKISLLEMNQLIQHQDMNGYSPERFFHLLLKENKIHIEDFADWNPFSTPRSNEFRIYRLRKIENEWTFYLETSESDEQFGPYRLLEELGQGGMGSVYKAYHPGLNQTVALKIIRNREHLHESTLKRFQREIQIMAKLDHPGIVKIFSAGEEEQTPYFVMELVSGDSLEKQQDHFYLREKLEIIKKVLNALDYAHQQKILHRDLKLENILMTEMREPKIADFGLAKEIAETPETLKLTQSGIIVGTAHYLSPEQIRGANSEIDERSDLYSIGICLYKLVSGRYPYEAQTLPDLFQKILTATPAPLHRREKKIHPDLEAIIFKAIEKDPSQRYFNANHLKKDLAHFLNGYPISATTLSRTRQFRKWLKKYRNSLNFFYALLLVLLSFSMLVGFLNFQWRQDSFNSSYNKIRMKYLALQKASWLPIEKKQQLFKILNEIHEMEWVNHPQAESLKWDVAQDLLTLAYENKSFYWANYLVDELQRLESIPIQERQKIKDHFLEKRQENFLYHRKRWFAWLKKVQDRKLTSEEAEEMVYELAQLSEEQIFQDLLRRIEEGNAYMAQLSSIFPSRKNELYKILVKIAGHTKNHRVIPVLLSGFRQISNEIAQENRKLLNPEKAQYAIFLFRSPI